MTAADELTTDATVELLSDVTISESATYTNTITVKPYNAARTITVAPAAQVTVSGTVTFCGKDDTNTLTVTGNNGGRSTAAFSVASGGTLTLGENLTVTGMKNASTSGKGAVAIANSGSTVIVAGASITDNAVNLDTSGALHGNGGTLDIRDGSTITDNMKNTLRRDVYYSTASTCKLSGELEIGAVYGFNSATAPAPVTLTGAVTCPEGKQITVVRKVWSVGQAVLKETASGYIAASLSYFVPDSSDYIFDEEGKIAVAPAKAMAAPVMSTEPADVPAPQDDGEKTDGDKQLPETPVAEEEPAEIADLPKDSEKGDEQPTGEASSDEKQNMQQPEEVADLPKSAERKDEPSSEEPQGN